MRFVLPLLALALVLPPTASATSTSTLSIVAPPQGDANVAIPLEITLTIQDFACASDTWFAVDLNASAPAGSPLPTLDAAQVSFLVPAGTYLIDPWTGNASANLTVTADAATTSENVTIRAVFTAATAAASCVTSRGDGFAGSEASAIVHVGNGTPAPPTPPPAPTPTPATEPTPAPTPTQATPTPTTPTNSTNETAPTSTTPSDSNNTATNGSVDQLPPGGGYIGDYAPAESAKSTPAPALAGVLAAAGAAVVVLAAKRRRN